VVGPPFRERLCALAEDDTMENRTTGVAPTATPAGCSLWLIGRFICTEAFLLGQAPIAATHGALPWYPSAIVAIVPFMFAAVRVDIVQVSGRTIH